MSTGIPYGGAAQRWHDNPLQEEVDRLRIDLERAQAAFGVSLRHVNELGGDVDRLRAALGQLLTAMDMQVKAWPTELTDAYNQASYIFVSSEKAQPTKD
jgi:hypothetical protein